MTIRVMILVTLGLCTGCVSSGTKVTAKQQSAFQAGATTEAQVIAQLGQPNSVSTLADGTKIDIYSHIAAHANAASYVPIVGVFAGGAKSTTDTVNFTYDPQGILKSMTSNRSQMDVNTGLANQH